MKMQEGFAQKKLAIENVGDVMQDSALLFAQKAKKPNTVSYDSEFILATIHRAGNTDNPERLTNIINALNYIHQNIKPIILPLHPRTKKLVEALGIQLNVEVIEPVGYLEMLWLLQHCKLVLTDSGGVQKEAFFFRKPCVTMRDQTEWVELVSLGVNQLVGADTNVIVETVKSSLTIAVEDHNSLYGGGQASQKIVEFLVKGKKNHE